MPGASSVLDQREGPAVGSGRPPSPGENEDCSLEPLGWAGVSARHSSSLEDPAGAGGHPQRGLTGPGLCHMPRAQWGPCASALCPIPHPPPNSYLRLLSLGLPLPGEGPQLRGHRGAGPLSPHRAATGQASLLSSCTACRPGPEYHHFYILSSFLVALRQENHPIMTVGLYF